MGNSKNKFSFYFNKILIFVMLFVSLFFFTACDDEDDENKPMIILSYKPYSTAQVNPLNIFENYTYADLIKEKLGELSTTILTGVVEFYGLKEISSEERLNGVDLQSLFNMSSAPSETRVKSLIYELNSMTNIYVDVDNKILILSNSSINVSDYLNINEDKYYAQMSMNKLSDSGGNVSSGNELENNCAYKRGSGLDTTFVFVGGSVGSNIYIGSGSDFTNTKNYVSKLLASYFNIIERDLTDINIIDGSNTDLKFSKWNYSLGEEVFLYEEYLMKYILKYNLSLQVELAKVMLVGSDELPTDLPTKLPDGSNAEANLKQVYEKASSLTASVSEKQKFIDEACLYLDHIGLSDVDAEMLIEAFYSKIIGTESYNASESNLLYKNNYQENLTQIFEIVQTLHKPKPILNFIVKDKASILEEIELKGYINSVIFLSEKSIDPDMFTLIVNKEDFEDIIYDYVVAVRYNDNATVPVESIFLDANEQLNDGSEVLVDISEMFEENPVSNSNKDFDVTDFACEFGRFKNPNGENYTGWFFNKDTQYLEVVFATKNVFTKKPMIIDVCSYVY